MKTIATLIVCAGGLAGLSVPASSSVPESSVSAAACLGACPCDCCGGCCPGGCGPCCDDQPCCDGGCCGGGGCCG